MLMRASVAFEFRGKNWLTGDLHRGAVHGGVISSHIESYRVISMLRVELLVGRSWRDPGMSLVRWICEWIIYCKGPTADLIGEASVVRMGNRVAVAKMEVFSGEQSEGDQPKPFAAGQAVYNISKGKR